MKKLSKFIGTFCLGIAALIVFAGPASLSMVAVEKVPESIKNKR